MKEISVNGGENFCVYVCAHVYGSWLLPNCILFKRLCFRYGLVCLL